MGWKILSGNETFVMKYIMLLVMLHFLKNDEIVCSVDKYQFFREKLQKSPNA